MDVCRLLSFESADVPLAIVVLLISQGAGRDHHGQRKENIRLEEEKSGR